MRAGSRPLALVYRGGASLPGCAESVADLLQASRWNFDVRYVGPREALPLTDAVLAQATLYAQPGGGTLGPAWRRMRKHSKRVRRFVAGGGRYVGFCLGGYLAGATPGFDLLPGDTDQYIVTDRATVDSTRPTLVEVDWRDDRRRLYFQDGATFHVRPQTPDLDVIATYPNGEIAALAVPFGGGRVAVVGPHPEADGDWFADSDLRPPADDSQIAGLELIDAVMS
ncbi:BPL-N domain-containing protein [Rhodococcus sp. ACT016]|uniref:BPL-N domain-containing protein n=1 Tax=Rhodococcus sp. ACT016 TaxID=3134808 RepID=UPI003D26A6AA